MSVVQLTNETGQITGFNLAQVVQVDVHKGNPGHPEGLEIIAHLANGKNWRFHGENAHLFWEKFFRQP